MSDQGSCTSPSPSKRSSSTAHNLSPRPIVPPSDTAPPILSGIPHHAPNTHNLHHAVNASSGERRLSGGKGGLGTDARSPSLPPLSEGLSETPDGYKGTSASPPPSTTSMSRRRGNPAPTYGKASMKKGYPSPREYGHANMGKEAGRGRGVGSREGSPAKEGLKSPAKVQSPNEEKNKNMSHAYVHISLLLFVLFSFNCCCCCFCCWYCCCWYRWYCCCCCCCCCCWLYISVHNLSDANLSRKS